MSDGASTGINAKRAIEIILGGKEAPTEEEQQSPEQMLDAIREATEQPSDYGAAALSYARVILEAYDAHPVLREQPMEAVYLYGADGHILWTDGHAVVLQPNLYDVLKQLHPDEECWQRKVMSSLSGFQAGWAHNTIRYVSGEPPKQNPALIDVAI